MTTSQKRVVVALVRARAVAVALATAVVVAVAAARLVVVAATVMVPVAAARSVAIDLYISGHMLTKGKPLFDVIVLSIHCHQPCPPE